MARGIGSQRIGRVRQAMAPFVRFFEHSQWARRKDEPGICDFVLGNPHEMPLAGVVAALEQHVRPADKDWFGYKTSEPASRAIVAAALREHLAMPFEDDDVLLTNGAFAALATALCALVDPGDEVIYLSPPWFFYESLIVAYGAEPVRVEVDRETFEPDVAAIEAAITARTRAIVINSPNNPTGKVYPPALLGALAEVLRAASARHGGPIYLLSDEAYRRIVFDGRDVPSPTAFYRDSLLLYTYGKTLLTPGQRLGYIALPPSMGHREDLRAALTAAQFVTGFAFPNALMQHALADLERLSIDVGELQRKRDRLVAALRTMGYELQVPEGTFYLLVRSPQSDDVAFVERLAEHDVFCLPGTFVELPGTFRISLTANDEMISRALPGFEAALAGA